MFKCFNIIAMPTSDIVYELKTIFCGLFTVLYIEMHHNPSIRCENDEIDQTSYFENANAQ